MMKKNLTAGIVFMFAILSSSASLGFDASDAVGPSYKLQLMSPNTWITPNWFGERKLIDPTSPIVFKLITKDDKNWVRLSSMTNWIIVSSYTRKKNVNIPPACGNPAGVKSQANVFENLSARNSLPNGEKTQEFTIVALLPPLPAVSSPIAGCEQYFDSTSIGSVIGPSSNYLVGSWISAPSTPGIVLIGDLTDEAGRTQTREQSVGFDNSPYFDFSVDPKTFNSKVWATGINYTLADQAKLNFARYGEIKDGISQLSAELESLKNQPTAVPGDLAEINTQLSRAKAVISSVTNEMAFQAFYIEPTSARALQLPLVSRGTIVEEVDFESLSAFRAQLELLKSRLSLQSTPKPSPTPSLKTSSQPKLITLTCQKGKTIKKVSGRSPKCPIGYKQVGKPLVGS